MSGREERAARRRVEWSGEVVELGQPKGPLYASLTPEQRLQAFIELNHRVWKSVGVDLTQRMPRNEWPGEIFELGRRG